MTRGSHTRLNILRSAVELVSFCGISGITIGSLAKLVGMSKSGLFAHFRSKENLQVMVIELAAQDFTEKVLKGAFKEARGEPRIRKILENWVHYLTDEKSLPGGKVLIEASIEMNSRSGSVKAFIQEAQKGLMNQIKKSSEIAKAENHFRKNLDSEFFAWSLYGIVLAYFHSKKMLNDPKAEVYLNKNFEILLEYSKEQKKEGCKAYE